MIAEARGHGRALPLAGARPARGRHGPNQMQAQWLTRVTAAASEGSREGGTTSDLDITVGSKTHFTVGF